MDGPPLTPDQEEEVIEKVAQGATARGISREYGIKTHAAQLAAAKAKGRLEERAKQQAEPPAAEVPVEPEPRRSAPSEQAERAAEQMIAIVLSLPPGERKWVIARLLGDLPQQPAS